MVSFLFNSFSNESRPTTDLLANNVVSDKKDHNVRL